MLLQVPIPFNHSVEFRHWTSGFKHQTPDETPHQISSNPKFEIPNRFYMMFKAPLQAPPKQYPN
jgi:hypothetical protein